MQVINSRTLSLFANETRCRDSRVACKHSSNDSARGAVSSITYLSVLHRELFFTKVDDSAGRLEECFRPILGTEIFQRGSVGAVSYNCTDDNKYRARRAVKSNRLRL